jgi:4-hydroxy-3-methylbut-2-en-1-yl diphosphate synthase IspG/GcpE
MRITLNTSSISEDVLKKYQNGRGEGILSMFINSTIADLDYRDGANWKEEACRQMSNCFS